jgi:hypothetical protein
MSNWSPQLFVFIDESGNFDFSNKGTRHFVLGAVVTTEPAVSAGQLIRLRYQLLTDGLDQKYFHASEDRQFVRDKVFEVVAQLSQIRFCATSTDKSELGEHQQSASVLYSIAGGSLIARVMEICLELGKPELVLIFDKALRASEEKALLKAIKPALKLAGIRYKVYFQNVKFDSNGQIADYVAWANYVALERKEFRPLQALNK